MKNYKTSEDFLKSSLVTDFKAILDVFGQNAALSISGGGGGMNRKDAFQIAGADTFVPNSEDNSNANTTRATLLVLTTDGRRFAARQLQSVVYDKAIVDAEEDFAAPVTLAQALEFIQTARDKKWWFVVVDRNAEGRTARDGRQFTRTTLKFKVFDHKPTDKEISDAVAEAIG